MTGLGAWLGKTFGEQENMLVAAGRWWGLLGQEGQACPDGLWDSSLGARNAPPGAEAITSRGALCLARGQRGFDP